MAIADITAGLRKTIISARNITLSGECCKTFGNFTRCGSTLAVARASGSAGPTGSAEQPGARTLPLIRAASLHLLLPQTGSWTRGLASKAHTKYDKKKKAPVDRFGSLDPSQPRLGFDKVKELEDASEDVKRIFSLEFGTGTDLHRLRRKISEDLVNDHPDEEKDLAVKIATITEHIRALAPHVEKHKKDSINKVKLLNAIDRRRKMLKYLRKRNYKRFERLLDELNLTWTPPPEYFKRKTRRSTEKQAFVKEAHAKKRLALVEFEQRWREEKMVEIAQLKEELGKELEEEEKEVLARHREESSV